MSKLTTEVVQGDARAIARMIRRADDRAPGFREELRELLPHTGRAQIIGVTGNPGVGKSTLVDRLIEAYRSRGKRVGVVAVDPSSPLTGGAILGDRIRMQRHALDDGVFIRSLATRGHLGGLSRSATDVARVLDAAGFDVILIETVGVGQDEVEITRAVHTTVLVVAPGLGDEVQAIKAGILEIADLFVVNKADRDGADATARDLDAMLSLRSEPAFAGSHSLAHAHKEPVPERGPGSTAGWSPPVLRTVASGGEGIGELLEAVESHRLHLAGTQDGQARLRRRAEEELLSAVRERLTERAQDLVAGCLPELVDRIVERRTDPYDAAAELVP
ncbi:MAG: methylmalonyl Co-A mutase-associated GTPase MeaB [Deltaproteobacteria bacterium]|nr:methylmalonyl Co-A mutase-associated GTPase MeaB [Deltaproteobacteria bacterium]